MIQLSERSRDILIKNALAVLSKQHQGQGAGVDTYNKDDHAYVLMRSLSEAGVVFPTDSAALTFVMEILLRGGDYRSTRDAINSPKTVKVAAPTVIDTSLLS